MLLRTFVKPVWLPGPPKVETWTCPACGRDVERTNPARHGIWVTAEPREVVALCSRTHGGHDRMGQPPPADDDEAVEVDDEWIPDRCRR